MDFKDLNLTPPILKALQQQGYTEPTPIQQQAIPPVLAGRDVLGCAQTGTGKTAAFAIPMLQTLSARPSAGRKIRALILTPTRELALQIFESFQAYGANLSLRSCVIFGGVSQKPQEEELRRGVDILVATPGRLVDLINQGLINLREIEIFVLDEADRMLDMGFIHDVKRIIALTPTKKQTLLFSATMPPEITAIVNSVLVDPVKIAVAAVSSTVDAIEQSVYFVDKVNKRELLKYLLKDLSITSALVFTRTKHGADRVARELVHAGYKAAAIHGDKSQGARQTALSSFKSGGIRVLVATDIAARGIDIDELSHVINFDLPNVPETYVHRIGRTGRAGLSGIAISLCDIEEKPYLMDIMKLTKRDIPAVTAHPYPMQVFEVPPKEPRPPRPARNAPQNAPHHQPTRQAAPAPRPKAGQAGNARPKAAQGTERQAPKSAAPLAAPEFQHRQRRPRRPDERRGSESDMISGQRIVTRPSQAPAEKPCSKKPFFRKG